MSQSNPWFVLILVCMAQFMVILDGTVVNVALPSIQRDLAMGESELQWVINSYTLIFGGFLLLGGRAGDLLGRKRLFLVGIVVFTVASMLNGLANSPEWLIIARGFQGLGGAFIAPAALSIVTITFAEGTERTKAMGVWSGIAAGGGAVGLLLGGVLTDTLSWPWVFFVNLPVGIIAFLLSLKYVPESRDASAHRGFDIAGAVTVTAGLIALVYGIVKTTDEGWVSLHTLTFGAIAVTLLGAFLLIEARSSEPLVRLNIFRNRTIRTPNIVMLLVAAGLFAMFFFNSIYVQRILGYSPIRAGFAFLPITFGIVIGAGLSQVLVRKLGLRNVGLIGLSLASISLLLMLRLNLGATYVSTLFPALMCMSIGMGLTFVPMTLIATSGVSEGDAGLASGLLNTSQQIGGALGLAVLSALSTSRTTEVLTALGAPPNEQQLASAMIEGFHVAFLVGAILMAAGAVLLLLMLKPSDLTRISAVEESRSVAL